MSKSHPKAPNENKFKKPWIPAGTAPIKSKKFDQIECGDIQSKPKSPKSRVSTRTENVNGIPQKKFDQIGSGDYQSRPKSPKSRVRTRTENINTLPQKVLDPLSSENKFSNLLTIPNDYYAKQICLQGEKEEKIETLYLKLHQLKGNLHHYNPIYDSLKSIMQLLHEPLQLKVDEELRINQMVSQTDRASLEFFELFNEFKNHIASSEMVLKTDAAALSEHLHAAFVSKEKLILKLLEVYDNMTSSLAYMNHVIRNEQSSSFFLTQKNLNDKLNALQNSLLTRESKILELENNLTLAKEKNSSLVLNQKTLDDKISRLEMEIEQKNSKIAELTMQLNAAQFNNKGMVENEKLIQVVEALKKKSEFEINTLVKATKVQQEKFLQQSSTISQLQKCVDDKEREILELGKDRDRWKIEATSLNNKIVHSESQLELLSTKHSEIEQELKDLKNKHKKITDSISSSVGEKEALIKELTEENTKLSNAIDEAEECNLSSEKMLKELQEKFVLLESKLIPSVQGPITHNKEFEDKFPTLFPLLQELKIALAVTCNNTNTTAQKPMAKFSEEKLVRIVKEILQLIETKDLKQNTTEENKTNQEIISLENKVHELQAQLNEKCDRFEKQLNANTRHSVEDVDIQLQRRETVDLQKLNMESDIQKMSHEIASLKRKNLQLQEKYESRLKEMKNDLDRVTSNYENSQKYITRLTTSYANVFGEPLGQPLSFHML